MEYFTEEDLKVFDESTRLRNELERLEKEVKELLSQQGEISEVKFKEYLDAANEWKKFFNENMNVLAAKIIG